MKNVIDPALLRPGRFDLTIDVPHPSKEGREEILNYYFSKGTVQITKVTITQFSSRAMSDPHFSEIDFKSEMDSPLNSPKY